MFKGLITALITPFAGEVIDYTSLKKIINLQIEAEITSIVVGGSTGEGNSLNIDEYLELINQTINICRNKIRIIPTVSSASTHQSVIITKKLSDLPIDALMCTVPYYTRPSPKGILEHFQNIHDNTNLPIMIYNHPQRTGVDIDDATIVQLSKLERVLAIKDASDNTTRPLRIKQLLSEHNKEFYMLTANEVQILAHTVNGGSGCVSVLSNVKPKLCKTLYECIKTQSNDIALKIQQNLMELYDALLTEPNPVGIKYLASLYQLSNIDVRLPLVTASINNQNKILIAFKKLKNKESNIQNILTNQW
ncbi:4-hydroxy-tetrahydrodipicolinate synthase [Rickettsia endosymbiont of Cardiosporidium cionae]|uniref:4-hydroxy-tetrahydrodipicolinate synthase n=1 Tax=Rickettsia endosymbiont of Cardiosporidium cionae TaxID=2777155 RepID=UPI001892F44C|nr:4-hydroxy-tetrahydrodipicolinate synthase [Rickettsia endosymbiont of Cardiosporidium cionae]KAF8818779.1 4-hydroxy-tetrahydrodipicolinate synthase [Rickettsia endosymbiont of Cardiosporidium cionae]